MFLRKNQSIPLITSLALDLGKRVDQPGFLTWVKIKKLETNNQPKRRDQIDQMIILRTVFKYRKPKENPSENRLIGAIQPANLKGKPYLLRG